MDNDCRDMLVKLYELPTIDTLIQRLESMGIVIRRALAPEKHIIIKWVKENFSSGWADECDVSFSQHPVRCFVATIENRLIGISVYDAICLGTIGPLGIDEEYRGIGLGKALMTQMLHDMRSQGYAYGVMGWIEPKTQKFFEKIVNAEVISGSMPKTGMYKGLLVSTTD
jgi:GNAT superfamily N-acetyltransferase